MSSTRRSWRRRAFGLASMVSLLTCAAAVVLWSSESLLLRGWDIEANRMHRDELGWSRYELKLVGGGIGYRVEYLRWAVDTGPVYKSMIQSDWNSSRAFDCQSLTNYADYPDRNFGHANPAAYGFSAWSVVTSRKAAREYGADHGVVIPCWAVFCVSAILPLLWSLRRRRHGAHDTCEKCGYNLTANASGTCPQCGKPAPRKSEAVA